MRKETPSISELNKALKASQRETFEKRRRRTRVYRTSVIVLIGLIIVAVIAYRLYGGINI